MKLTMSKFYLLCTAIETMQKTAVAGMAKYVWDLNNATLNDRVFYMEQIKSIQKKHGKVDENCKEYQELMEYETSELPILPKGKIDKLDEYPFLPIQYGLMLELIEKEEKKEDGDI